MPTAVMVVNGDPSMAISESFLIHFFLSFTSWYGSFHDGNGAFYVVRDHNYMTEDPPLTSLSRRDEPGQDAISGDPDFSPDSAMVLKKYQDR